MITAHVFAILETRNHPAYVSKLVVLNDPANPPWGFNPATQFLAPLFHEVSDTYENALKQAVIRMRHPSMRWAAGIWPHELVMLASQIDQAAKKDEALEAPKQEGEP